MAISVGAIGAWALGAIGTTVAATSAAAIVTGSLIVGVGEIGLTYVAQSVLTPKPKTDTTASYSTLQTGGILPQSFLMGETATAGSLVWFMDWGKDGSTPNAYETRVISLSDLPINALTGLQAYSKSCTYGSGTPDSDMGYAIPEFNTGGKDYLWVKFYDGTQTTADSWLVSKFSSDPDRPYASTRVGYGRAYVIVTMRLNQKLFTGDPGFKFQVEGAKWYDPTQDTTAGGSGSQSWDDPSTWEYTNNPQIIRYNIRRGVYYNSSPKQWLFGPQNMSAARLPYDNWAAAINDCATEVDNQAGGTEAQYRCGGEVTVDTEPADLDESLMRACNGRSIEIGGIYKATTGVIGSAVASYTDADFIVTQQKTFDQYPGLSGTVNGITGHFPDPTQNWAMVDAPGLFDSDLEAQDGNRQQLADISYDCVPFAEQVQRNMKAALAEERRWRIHTAVLPHTAWQLEPGDAISWTSDENGYDNKLFRVESTQLAQNRDVQLTIREADPSDYDWDPSADFVPVPAGSISGNTLASQAMVGWAVEPATISGDDGRAEPGIQVSWGTDDIDDVDGVVIDIRLTSSAGIVWSGETPHSIEQFLTGSFIPAANLSANTAYQVRGRYRPISIRDTDWSDWLDVTTPDIKIAAVDIGEFEIDVSKLDAETQAAIAAIPVMQPLVDNSQASLRTLAQIENDNAAAILNLSVALNSHGQNLGGAIAYANQEITKTVTAGLAAEAQARLDLASIVDGLTTGDDDLALAARVTTLEDTSASLVTGKADASDLALIDAQLNTPGTGLAAQVSNNTAAIATLDPSSATATIQQSAAAVRAQGLQLDSLGETLLDILTALQSSSQNINATIAFYTNSITSTVVEGQSASAQALSDLTAMLQSADADLSANIEANDSASVSRDDDLQGQITSNTSSITTLESGLTTANGNIATNASNLSSLTTTVTSQGSSLTSLSSTVTSNSAALVTANDNIAANASEISSVSATVTSQGATLSTAVDDLSTLTTTVGDHTSSITSLTSSVDGMSSQWGVQVNTDGAVTSYVHLDGSDASSNFAVAAENFYYYDPTSGATPLFSITGGVAYFAAPLVAELIDSSDIIAYNVIVTGHLTGNAVSQTVAFPGAGTVLSSIGTSEGPVFTFSGLGASLAVSDVPAGGRILIRFDGSFTRAGGHSPTVTLRLYRGANASGTLLNTSVSGGSGVAQCMTFGIGWVDSGVTGSVNYFLTAQSNDNACTINDGVMYAMNLKNG